MQRDYATKGEPVTIRELRKLSGLTQEELAELCPRTSNTKISLVERGLKLRHEEECSIRAALLQVIKSRNVEIEDVLVREAVAV
jgi:transcriptional regulator with XRE-family HTH domain